MKKIAAFLWVFLSGAVFCGAHAAEENASQPVAIPQISEQWRFSITPYLWAVNNHGQIYYKDRALANTTMTTSEMLSSLKFGAMLEAEVHKGKWGFAANLLYSDLKNTDSRVRGQVDLGSTTSLQMGIYNLTGTYTVMHTKNLYVDALAGVRIFTQDVNTDVNVQGTPRGTQLKSNSTLTNPIVGLKGRVRIADSDYFVPFYLDVGGGVDGTQVTTQAVLGIGKAYGWGDVMLLANNVFYRTKSDNVTTNLDFYGAAVGVTFKF